VQSVQIGTNGQLFNAEDIGRVVVTYRNGAPVRLDDIAQVVSGSENPLQASWVGTERGEMIGIWRQPGANTIDLVDRIKAVLPTLQAGIPPGVNVSIISDRSASIRESFADVKLTLIGAIVLVVLVIFAFLRSFWATAIPGVTVPLSLVGTFGVMYLLGYSLDNLSLMALTLAVGLVVDDAIVVLENIFRHLEQGRDRVTAALMGSQEIGFTIVSITVSLIAVFIPLLFMTGIVGRLFTILLSLPSASVGALFFLWVFGFDLTMMAIIGLLMLIGIVKKNAIMMIDFALERLRVEHMPAEKAIYEAAVLRFRPIMMTTMSAIFVTLPIAVGIGAGSDLRQPLGIAVVGGLIVSQALTLFTTPVTYLYMERFAQSAQLRRFWRRSPAGIS
jgi:multidrug efflux pump subunit AcrB